jgi:hypothetical protein
MMLGCRSSRQIRSAKLPLGALLCGSVVRY